MPASSPPSSPAAEGIALRRLAFAGLCLATWMASLSLAAAVVRPGEWSLLPVLILLLYAGQLPWSIIGFWNAVIGFAVTRLAADPLAVCCPPALAAGSGAPITTEIAVLMCIRNEETASVFGRLDALMAELDATGFGRHFHLHVLSDTADAGIADAETIAMQQLSATWGDRLGGLAYRRRQSNEGFKAGNIRDFCLNHATDYDFALVLDADSFMSGAKILDCVRIMQATPALGILQCLTVGLPSVSPLARVFQFGMRLGMRSYTLGGAWWQADCGPYWGHNAVLRLAPFAAHCDLPRLPGRPPFGGDILSHDQVEAVLMRRAGYEVRVIPTEGGSYEENPPTLIEFIRRDLRWCLGNLQYGALLGMPGLKVTSRIQLLLAIWMFLASAFNVGFWCLILAQTLLRAPGGWIAPGPGLALVAWMIVLTLAPKLATGLAVLLDRRERAAWGGAISFIAGFLVETLFSLILTPIMQLSETAAIGMLCFGRTIGWQAQMRGEHAIGWAEAAARFWPHTLAGLLAAALLATLSQAAALWSLPVYGGLLLAVPLAVITASPRLGRRMAEATALAIPEERHPASEILALDLAALSNPLTATPQAASKGAEATPVQREIT